MRAQAIVTLTALLMLVSGAGTARAQSSYVAFTQAGGFDRSRAFGFGTASDLNSAIGIAHAECQKQGSSCGDQGWCALRPGMFSAWASNRELASGSGVACNLPTLEQAEARAMSECGSIHLGNPPPCEILWSGPGIRRSDSVDELRQWVRLNFRRVAGWSPDENAVIEYVNQLQAWASRVPMQQGKDFLLKEVFPSLRR